MNAKSKKNIACCVLCGFILTSTFHCTNTNCPKKEPDEPIKHIGGGTLDITSIRPIISTATGTAFSSSSSTSTSSKSTTTN